MTFLESRAKSRTFLSNSFFFSFFLPISPWRGDLSSVFRQDRTPPKTRFQKSNWPLKSHDAQNCEIRGLLNSSPFSRKISSNFLLRLPRGHFGDKIRPWRLLFYVIPPKIGRCSVFRSARRESPFYADLFFSVIFSAARLSPRSS